MKLDLFANIGSFSSFYLQFDFMYETNLALRHNNPKLGLNFKNKKIYIFITDAFRIWHDYAMTYIGIEDINGHNSQNIRPFFNLNNSNQFTVSVTNLNNGIYKGKMYLNGNKANSLSFTGNKLSYILFCHLDISCNSIHWTSGYYKTIRIWDDTNFPFVNDDMVYNSYIYDSFMYWKTQKRYYMNQLYTTTIPMNLKTIRDNILSVIEIDTIKFDINNNQINGNSNLFQLYNFNDKQEVLSLDNYIDNNSEKKCNPNCITCHGEGNEFTNECNVCDDSISFFRDSNCMSFPTQNKGYYALVFPLKTPGDLEISGIPNFNDRITITFWMKLIGFKQISDEFLIFNCGKVEPYLSMRFNSTSKNLVFRYINQTINVLIASLPFGEYLGKYVHISISYFKFQNGNPKKGYLSIQVNRIDLPIQGTVGGQDFHFYPLSILENGYYALFTKFYISHSKSIIGGYAFNTNTVFDSQVQFYKIIDETSNRCLNYGSSNQYEYECIIDYDVAFNNDNYLSKAAPDEMKIYTTENDDYSIKQCSNKCATFCYNEDDEQSCACMSDSLFEYLIESDQKVKCKKLDYIDFNRIKTITFNHGLRGTYFVEMWINVQILEIVDWKTFFSINFGPSSSTLEIKYTYNIRPFNDYILKIDCKGITLLYLQQNEQGNWKHLGCSVEINNKITISSSDNHSFGLLFIRQLRIWRITNNIPDRDNYSADNIIDKVIGSSISSYDGLLFTLDSIIDQSYNFQAYSTNGRVSFQIETKKSGNDEFSYYPVKEVSPLHLCEEDEFCGNVLKINQIQQKDQQQYRMYLKDIRPSGNSRYTIEAWIKVEGADNFLNGINMIWQNHISLSILTDKETNSLSYYCFPQDYLTSPLIHRGRNIIKQANKALNKEMFTLDMNKYDNKWVYLRCSYHWDNEIFYLKSEDTIYPGVEKSVNKENTYPGMTVDYPFKYLFNDYEFSNFIIDYENLSNTDIIISLVRLYSEYLPRNYDTSRVLFSSNAYISSLELQIDFSQYDNNQNPMKLYALKEGSREIIKLDATGNYIALGNVLYCHANNANANYKEKYDPKKLICVKQSCAPPDPSISIFDGCSPLECSKDFFLEEFNNPSCVEKKCNTENMTRAPGSNENSAFCNYECDNNHVPCNFVNDFPNNLRCNSGYTRVGYKCLPTNTQENAAFYFNRCYNFFPIYKRFSTTMNYKMIDGYAIEFSFKFDKVNEFCKKPSPRYVFWAHPHYIYQIDSSDDVYYEDKEMNKKNILKSIHPYEWNYIIIRYQNNKVSVFVNMKLYEPEFEYDITPNPEYRYNLTAIAFCTGEHQCEPLGEKLKINWTSAYYKNIRIYDLKQTNIYTINDYIQKRVQIETTSILIYYLFNNIHNDLNTVYNEIDLTDTSLQLKFHQNIPISSVYRTNDLVLMYSSSANFDWGEVNLGKYVTSVEAFTGKVTFSSCHSNCARCYDSNEDSCYQCNIGYTLYRNKCVVSTGYYMQFPSSLNQDLTVNFGSFDITQYNPVTVSFWIKFYGIKRKISIPSVNPTANCVLLVRISNVNTSYLCYNIMTNHIVLYYNLNTILYNDNSFMTLSGDWVLMSFSNYNSINTSPYYPNIFSFAFSGNTVKRENTYNIPSPGITIDTLVFGYGISGSIADIRVYQTFIMNPFGIVTNSESTLRYLVYNKILYSNTVGQCVSDKDFNVDISLTVQCYEDYNLYHDKTQTCDNDKDKIITGEGCKDCIEECSYCGGESKLNCACYYNTFYWFRKDPISNQVYCQRLPHHDFNIYSLVEFTNIDVATTNEYAIEFYYFIYEYDKTNILFNYQEITWHNHIKININNDRGYLVVDCYPISEKALKVRDDSHTYFKWNHVVCGTSLKTKKYYLNNLGVNSLNDDIVMIDSNPSKTKLSFTNENGSSGVTSHGVFMIKELKLWSMFSIREFPTDCIYKSSDVSSIPFLLHYFPFTVPLSGDIIDSQGVKATTKISKQNIIGYNLIDYDNIYKIEEEKDECLLLYTIPSMGYFNMTSFLIQSRDNINNIMSYSYNYYISEQAEKYYSQINQETFLTGSTLNEFLLSKVTDEKFKDVQLNIYVTVKDINNKIYTGFGRIEIYNYIQGRDVDYSKYTIGIEYPIVNSILLSDTQIWNRLYVLESLSSLYTISMNEFNITLSLNDYGNKNVNIYNPSCSEDFCSYQGKCYIVVRALACLCNDGYTGSNCHLTTSNKDYLSNLYHQYWNYFTNSNNYNSISFNKEKLEQLQYLVKASSFLVDVSAVLYKQYYDMMNYLQINYESLYVSNYESIFLTYNYILMNIHNSINSNRIYQYNNSNKTLTPGRRLLESKDVLENDVLPYTNLTFSEETKYLESALDLIGAINNLILTMVKQNQLDYELNYSSFDVTIKSINRDFDYENYFINRKTIYKSYFDGSNCQNYIFSSSSYSTLYLVIVEYKYNPLSYHTLYSNTSSYLNDIFFATPIGTKVDVIACPDTMSIYFPINLYDNSKKDFIQEYQNSYKTMSDGGYDKNSPYVTYPSYVFDNGEVSRKSRLERINEWSPRFMLNCSYFDKGRKDFTNINNISVSDELYMRCGTHHLSLFTMEGFDNQEDFPIAGLFFYLKCPQVFKCGKNYSNACFIFFVLVFVSFLISQLLICLMDMNTLRASNLLDNIKIEILKEHRMLYTDKEIMDELIEINKLKDQKKLEKEVGLRQAGLGKVVMMKEKDLSDKDLININYTTTANPPRRQNNYNSEDPFTNERDNYVSTTNMYDNDNEGEPRYRVQDYRPNNNLGQDMNEYFGDDDYDSFDNKEEDNKISEIKEQEEEKESSHNESNNNSIKTSNQRLPMKEDTYGQNFKDANFDDVRVSEHESSSEDDEEPPIDFFQKFTTISGQRKLKNNNFTLAEKYKKVTFVNEFDVSKKIPTFYQDIDKRNPTWKQFFVYLTLRRNIYLSPFTLSSTLNPRWKKLFLLYIYILLQFFYITLFLTLVERTSLPKGAKIILFSWVNLIMSNLSMYLITFLFRVDPQIKIRLFHLLQTASQMKLILEWKHMKKLGKRKLIGGMIVFICLFFLGFYFSFNYCSVLYKSRGIFVGTFIVSIICDLVFYETFLIGLLTWFYYKRQFDRKYNKHYYTLFAWKNFRCCI